MQAPSDKTPDCRSESNGLLAAWGSASHAPQSPLAIKLAMVSCVIGASAPPATATSASPERIMEAASAIASRPEGHAAETVAAFAEVPIRSAIILAGACGIEAADAVVGARLGPMSCTA